MEGTENVTAEQPSVDAVLSAMADAIEGLRSKIASLEALIASQKQESFDLIQKSLSSYVAPTAQNKEQERQPVKKVSASDITGLSFAQLNRLRFGTEAK